jgi:hypothetical protein
MLPINVNPQLDSHQCFPLPSGPFSTPFYSRYHIAVKDNRQKLKGTNIDATDTRLKLLTSFLQNLITIGTSILIAVILEQNLAAFLNIPYRQFFGPLPYNTPSTRHYYGLSTPKHNWMATMPLRFPVLRLDTIPTCNQPQWKTSPCHSLGRSFG